jgi:phosphate transport system substrate-binding protein
MRLIGVPVGLATLSCAFAPLAAEDVDIVGSTTVEPIMSAAAKVFTAAHPEVNITVHGNGSENGIALAAAGKVAIGMISRPLNDADRKDHPDLVDTAIGSDGLVFIVPTAVTATRITSDQVRGIYTGAITNWLAVGGTDGPIVPIGRDQSHGSAKVFADFFHLEAAEEFLGAAPMIHERLSGSATPGTVVVLVTSSNNESLDQVRRHPGSIGYCSAAEAAAEIAKGAPIHILSLDGVAGTTAAIRDGTYPLRRPLVLVTKGPPRGTAKAIIDFMLSPAGQQIVEASQYLPLADPASGPATARAIAPPATMPATTP